MKYRKRIAFFLLTAVCLFVLPGCSARKAIPASDFTTAAEAAGFSAVESEDESTSATGTVVQMEKDGISVTFIEYSSNAEAKEAYASQRSSMKASMTSGGAKEQTLDSDTYCKYLVNVGDMYYALVQNSNTVCFAKSTSDGQSEIEQLLKGMGYIS